LHVEDIKRIIREAGREPVERDTLYRSIRRERGVPVIRAVPV
jgi:2-iminoacetate synthase ThiH